MKVGSSEVVDSIKGDVSIPYCGGDQLSFNYSLWSSVRSNILNRTFLSGTLLIIYKHIAVLFPWPLHCYMILLKFKI
jgi:hypothetical protein